MNNTLRAALWMIGSIVSFTAMAVAGREAGRVLDTYEIMLYRSIIGFVIVVSVAGARGYLSEITTRHLGLQLVRNVSHFTGQNLWLYAVGVAPLAQVFALEFTQPLWVMPLAFLFLGEALTRSRIAFAGLGFLGILVITQPWSNGIGPGVAQAALAAVGFAGSVVFTKVLTRTETVVCILFWLSVMQGTFGLILAGYDMDIAWPGLAQWPWLVVIGLSGIVAHFCLTKALRLAPATVVVPIDFVRLPIIAIVAMILYAEPLRIEVFVGAALIFTANYLNIWVESRRTAAPLRVAENG